MNRSDHFRSSNVSSINTTTSVALHIALGRSKEQLVSNLTIPLGASNRSTNATVAIGLELKTTNNPTDVDWTRRLILQPGGVAMRVEPPNQFPNINTTVSTKRPFEAGLDDPGVGLVIDVVTPAHNNAVTSEEALLNRSSVLFVAVSFILLMVISLAWLVFYYVQRFRYLHSKERVSRRLAELARKAVARIPVKTLHPGDKETTSELDQCAICIEPFRPMDSIRILPCRHYFHKLCIDPWLLEQRSCPMCKLDILQAYGLRPDLYFGYNPNADPSSHATRPATVGTPPSEHQSGSDDDGAERVALVHSHSLDCSLTGTGPTNTAPLPPPPVAPPLPPQSPPLTYVVLTNAAVGSLAPMDSSMVPSPPIYYVHGPSSANASVVASHNPVTTTIDLPGLTAQVIVPVLPTLTMDMSSRHRPSLVWSADRGFASAGKMLDSQLLPCLVEQGVFEPSDLQRAPHLGTPYAQCLIATQPPIDPRMPRPSVAPATRNGSQDITYTTQTFTAPVCAVIAKVEHPSRSGATNTTPFSTAPSTAASSKHPLTAGPLTQPLVVQIKPRSATRTCSNAGSRSHEKTVSAALRSARSKSHVFGSGYFDRSAFSSWLPIQWRDRPHDRRNRRSSRLTAKDSLFCQLGHADHISPEPFPPSPFPPPPDAPGGLLDPLTSSVVTSDAEPAVGERVVFAVVETVPHHPPSSLTVKSDGGDGNSSDTTPACTTCSAPVPMSFTVSDIISTCSSTA
ncbi:unnamed protein product [Dicrocoelium dendriticum]|nr:unnamed protein product [Dicrocoelium dendriticum]